MILLRGFIIEMARLNVATGVIMSDIARSIKAGLCDFWLKQPKLRNITRVAEQCEAK